MRSLGIFVALVLAAGAAAAAELPETFNTCGKLQREVQVPKAAEEGDIPWIGVFRGEWQGGMDHALAVYEYKKYPNRVEAKGIYAIGELKKAAVNAQCWGFTGRIEDDKLTLVFPGVSTVIYEMDGDVLSGEYRMVNGGTTPGTFKRLK
ncbi:MAG: hypothetical protein ACRED5_22520 [Propylenella sp.]